MSSNRIAGFRIVLQGLLLMVLLGGLPVRLSAQENDFKNWNEAGRLYPGVGMNLRWKYAIPHVAYESGFGLKSGKWNLNAMYDGYRTTKFFLSEVNRLHLGPGYLIRNDDWTFKLRAGFALWFDLTDVNRPNSGLSVVPWAGFDVERQWGRFRLEADNTWNQFLDGFWLDVEVKGAYRLFRLMSVQIGGTARTALTFKGIGGVGFNPFFRLVWHLGAE